MYFTTEKVQCAIDRGELGKAFTSDQEINPKTKATLANYEGFVTDIRHAGFEIVALDKDMAAFFYRVRAEK